MAHRLARFPDVPPVVDFRNMPCAAVPSVTPACRSMLIAAALASDVASGPGLRCDIFSVPWPVSWPVTSHALKAVLMDTTFKLALFVPPVAAREYPDVVTGGLGCGFSTDGNA